MDKEPKEKFAFLKKIFKRNQKPTVIVKQKKTDTPIDVDMLVAKALEYAIAFALMAIIVGGTIKLLQSWFV